MLVERARGRGSRKSATVLQRFPSYLITRLIRSKDLLDTASARLILAETTSIIRHGHRSHEVRRRESPGRAAPRHPSSHLSTSSSHAQIKIMLVAARRSINLAAARTRAASTYNTEKTTFLLNWYANPYHTPIYVAKEQG